MTRIAILALQGAFAEHQQMLEKIGVETVQIRNRNDWDDFINDEKVDKKGLIIPGGESTTMMRLMHDLDLWDTIKDSIIGGLAVFGTCAGLIMLDSEHLNVMNITAKRNAYGRQLGSFVTNGLYADREIPMTFIRAPYIDKVGEIVEILSKVDGNIVAARQDNMLVTAFHPELNDNTFVHRYFLNLL